VKVEEIKTVGIVGAGLMGHGIAQVFGIKGYRVNLYDKDPGILESASGKIRANLQLFLELKSIKESDLRLCLNK
jgi:3-hydroxyacyl-CoA dehydrogenase